LQIDIYIFRPPWLELDTLYYFDPEDEGDNFKAKGEIKMLEC